MSELTFSVRFGVAGAVLAAVGVASCGADLVQPDRALPALELQVRFGADIPETARRVDLTLGAIPYCPAIALDVPIQPGGPVSPWMTASVQALDRSRDTMALTARGGGDPRAFGCPFNTPLVRFFEPWLFFDPNEGPGWGGPAVPWVPRDRIVAYADDWVTYQPQGPTDDQLRLPPGYSVLRRTCNGGDRAWRIELVDTQEPMTFFPSILPNFYPQPRPPELALREQSERLLLQECGDQLPPQDLGDRLTFDRATSIQFSADGSQLLYMVGIDPADPERRAPIRSVDLSTRVVRQVTAVQGGYQLQTTGRSEDIYVWTETGFQKLRVTGETIADVTTFPYRSVRSVSPDGRWMTFLESTTVSIADGWKSTQQEWIRDLDTGAARPIERGNLFWGWTPASQLMTIENPTETDALSYVVTISPVDGAVIDRFSFVRLHDVFWSAGVPHSIASPVLWRPEVGESRFAANDRGFGVSVEAAGTGDVVEVLDQRVGSIDVAARADGAAFLWARRCLGLFETVCTYELHRLTIPELQDDVVAVSDSAALVAVSPAGDRVAIASRDGVFLRALP